MSSKHTTMPSLRTREDTNPPRLPKPTVEDTKPSIRAAMFGCPHHDVVGKRKGRNLIVNIDGTSNQFSVHSTNIVELFSRIIKIGGDVEQLVFYNSGIGTYARPSFRSFSYWKQVIYNHIDTAIAWNFEKIIHAAYKWLSENYEPGDRIFLFGFSRGAYQVRVIAGMIEKVGLLHKGNENQIPFAYELYTALTAQSRGSTAILTSTEAAQPQNSESEEEKLCRSFKRSLCHENVKVHFVGAWDTVPSIGIFRGQSFPETVSGMGHVCHFRHALALDERRAKFQPEYVNGGLGPIEGSTRGDVKEVWFKGTHSDIGGGNVKNENLDNFTDSLRWMTYEAQACGLFIKPYKGKWIPVTPKESLTWIWMPLEYLPLGSLSYITQNSLTWRPHRGQPRIIQPGQRIHQSVFSKVVTELESSNDEREAVLNIPGAFPNSDESPETAPPEVPSKLVAYRPKAVFHSSLETDWEQLFSAFADSSDLPIIEQDPFENASHILASLSRACDILETEEGDKAHVLNTISADIQTLQSFLDDPTRLSSLLEVPNVGDTFVKVISTAVRLRSFATAPEAKLTIIRLLASAGPVQHPVSTGHTLSVRMSSAQVYEWGTQIPKAYRDDFAKILQPFVYIVHQEGFPSIQNVAFSQVNTARIIFTSCPDFGKTTSILTWDGSNEPPKNITNARGEYSTISRDGSLVAVWDAKDITIIDTTKQQPTVVGRIDDQDPYGSGDINSLCFSNDNQTFTTGHEDGWIKLWQRGKDRWEVFRRFDGGNSGIYYPAFSRDDSRLMFRVYGGSVNVWNLEDDAVVELEDPADSTCPVWSPSGDLIVAGTNDGTLKVWNPNSGKIHHIFKARRTYINCLAFRDDGKILAMGSDGNRIQGWRCDEWEKIWDFEIDDDVLSLAFSPDGKRLVSGGYRGSLHLWDVDMGHDNGNAS